MRDFLRFLKSVKLAVALLAFLAAGGALATVVPQGLADERYFELYPKIVALLVTQSGLNRFFESLPFLLACFAFFANLLACTVDRFLRELKKKRRRHGPDLLHVGLLVLVAGSLVSFSERKAGTVNLRPGDAVELPGGDVLTLRDFVDERHEGGRPKEWTSVVDVARKDGTVSLEGAAIRVNAPLRIDGLTLYQASYGAEAVVEIRGTDGHAHSVARGETAELDGASVFFMTVEGDAAAGGEALLRVSGVEGVVRVGAAPVEVAGHEAVLSVAPTAGLEAVSDPGYPLVLAGLLLTALGTAWTFLGKLKEASA